MSAVAGGRRVAEAVRDLSAAILRNEMLTPPARHRRVRDEGWKQAQPALRALDAALDRARRDIEAIEKRTAAPPQPTSAAEAMQATEIRAALAAMPPERRAAALSVALEAGDDRLHAAMLGGPAILSGLEPAALEIVRTTWREARHGPDTERVRRLRAATDDAQRAGELLNEFVSRQYDATAIEQGEAAERAEAAAHRAAQQALDNPLLPGPATAV